MAQAQGGTAGTSSSRGNGSLGAGAASRGGGLGGGLGGSNGGSNNAGNSKGNAASSNAASGASAGAAAAGATAAAAGDSKQTGGGLMGGLKSAVEGARSARASTSTSPGNAGSMSSSAAAAGAPQGALSAAAAGAPQGALSASDVAGIDSESHSAAENLAARDQGFRDTANAKTTAATMGGLGSVGSIVGNVASNLTAGAAPTEGSDLSANHNVGKAWANSVGPSKTVSMAASLAGGILGGPIGSALAGFALGIANDQAAKAANPQAMAATPQQIANRGTFAQQAGTSSSDQYDATGASSGTNNGSSMLSSMSAAAQPGAGFQAADDFSEQRKVDGLNLGSII